MFGHATFAVSDILIPIRNIHVHALYWNQLTFFKVIGMCVFRNDDSEILSRPFVRVHMRVCVHVGIVCITSTGHGDKDVACSCHMVGMWVFWIAISSDRDALALSA